MEIALVAVGTITILIDFPQMAMAKIGGIIEMVDLVGLISMEVAVQHVTREEATGTDQLLMIALAEVGDHPHLIAIECFVRR